MTHLGGSIWRCFHPKGWHKLAGLGHLLKKSLDPHLPDDVFITPAGGASEAGYIATIMIGQGLDVVVLLDSDPAGETAKDKLVKRWLTRYKSTKSEVFSLGDIAGKANVEFSIEDLFPEKFYLDRVQTVYSKQLSRVGQTQLTLQGGGQLCKRVERAMDDLGLTYNKGSVAKVIRTDLSNMSDASELPQETRKLGGQVLEHIAKHFMANKEEESS